MRQPYQRVHGRPRSGEGAVEWYEQGGHIQGAVEQGQNATECCARAANTPLMKLTITASA